MERRNFLGGFLAAIAGAAIPLKAFGTGSPIPSETIPMIESPPPKKKKKRKLKEPKVSDIVTRPFDVLNRAHNEFKMVPTGSIAQNPLALRSTNHAMLQELTSNIRVNGILNSLLVRYIGNGQYMVIDGLARLLAAKELGIKEIPVVVRKSPGLYVTAQPQDIWFKSVDTRLLKIMKNSILSQGFVQPCVLVNHGTGKNPSYEIVDGSLRVEAARQLGMKVPAIVYDWCREEIQEYRILQGDKYERNPAPSQPIGTPYKEQPKFIVNTDVLKVNVKMDNGFREAMHTTIKKHLKIGIIGG